MFGWLHSKVQKSQAAQQPSAGLAQPASLLEDLRQRRAPSAALATKARTTIAIIPG